MSDWLLIVLITAGGLALFFSPRIAIGLANLLLRQIVQPVEADIAIPDPLDEEFVALERQIAERTRAEGMAILRQQCEREGHDFVTRYSSRNPSAPLYMARVCLRCGLGDAPEPSSYVVPSTTHGPASIAVMQWLKDARNPVDTSDSTASVGRNQ